MRNKLSTNLRKLRLKKGVSLRTVEEETGISNAYLSQLERGLATNPNPTKLHALANYYGASYFELMASAGFLQDQTNHNELKLVSAPTLKNDHLILEMADLSEDEELMVKEYVEFLKSKRKAANN